MDWFTSLGLEVTGIHHITDSDIHPHLQICRCLLGKYTRMPISFNLDSQIALIRLKPCRVLSPCDPRSMSSIEQGVLKPVNHTKWEMSIVTPIKPDGSVRICMDYKCTLNKTLQQHTHPVLVAQHLLYSLGEGKVFTKLNLVKPINSCQLTMPKPRHY